MQSGKHAFGGIFCCALFAALRSRFGFALMTPGKKHSVQTVKTYSPHASIISTQMPDVTGWGPPNATASTKQPKASAPMNAAHSQQVKNQFSACEGHWGATWIWRMSRSSADKAMLGEIKASAASIDRWTRLRICIVGCRICRVYGVGACKVKTLRNVLRRCNGDRPLVSKDPLRTRVYIQPRISRQLGAHCSKDRRGWLELCGSQRGQ